ncbi:MAG: hypothetical protein ACW99A_11110 [Candidatus Kariarchaeaceae archaeon]|jgi:heme/copper-type cytochrome/quinol oxidase subunit 2
MRSGFLILFVFLLISSFGSTIQAAENDIPILGDDDKYHLVIVMVQWEYSVYNNIEDLDVESVVENNPIIAKTKNDEEVGPLFTGKGIIFSVYSRDVQHGFAISELGIAIATIRPQPNQVYGSEVQVETTLPLEPATVTSFCHIFCGLGHPDENLDFAIVNQINEEKDTNEINLAISILPIAISFLTVLIFRRKLETIKN